MPMSKNQARNDGAGFTLIELMITVAVVGILASVAYPSYVSTIKKARREDAIATLLALQLNQEKWRANNPTYTTTLTNLGYASGSTDSKDGYYTVAVSAATATTFTATATPKTGTAQASDTCTFTVKESGPDLATDASVSSATKRTCWNK